VLFADNALSIASRYPKPEKWLGVNTEPRLLALIRFNIAYSQFSVIFNISACQKNHPLFLTFTSSLWAINDGIS